MTNVVNVQAPTMRELEQWADELGLEFSTVLKDAGVSDPSKARASRARMAKGKAPRVRADLLRVLTNAERARKKPTEIGQVIVGFKDWGELGAELAQIEPDAFVGLLKALRDRVAKARETKRVREETKRVNEETEEAFRAFASIKPKSPK